MEKHRRGTCNIVHWYITIHGDGKQIIHLIYKKNVPPRHSQNCWDQRKIKNPNKSKTWVDFIFWIYLWLHFWGKIQYFCLVKNIPPQIHTAYPGRYAWWKIHQKCKRFSVILERPGNLFSARLGRAIWWYDMFFIFLGWRAMEKTSAVFLNIFCFC